MDSIKSRLTVAFEEPFWVAVCECESNGLYEVCKITFGAEPKDNEVYLFLLKNYNHLKFSTSFQTVNSDRKKVSPKRMQKIIKKSVSALGIGTKAQQQLKLQQEQGKLERRVLSREKNAEEKQRQFLLKQEKRKEKRRGH